MTPLLGLRLSQCVTSDTYSRVERLTGPSVTRSTSHTTCAVVGRAEETSEREIGVT